MALRTFDPGLAYDKATGKGIGSTLASVSNAATGLAVDTYDLEGNLVPVITNSRGYFGQFQADADIITVEIADVRFDVTSLEGSVGLVERAETAEQAARDSAAAAQDAASLVGAPADFAIATAMNSADTETRAALVTQVDAHLGGDATGLIGTVAGQASDIADLDALKQPRVNLVDTLTYPLYISHRGGPLRFPEHSLEGYRASAAAGFLPEQDLDMLADGTIVSIHDGTVDRTMTGATGAVGSLSLAQWKAARIKPARTGCPAAIPPTWEEILDEFGGRVVLAPEIKNAAATSAVIDSIKRRGLDRSIIVQSFTRSVCEQVGAAGLPALFLVGDETVTDFAAMKAAGIEFLGVGTAVGSTYIANAKAAGLRVLMWTVTTAAAAGTAFGKGVDGVFSDDAWWTSGRFLTLNADPYRTQVPWPHLVTTGTGRPVVFLGPDEVGTLGTGNSDTNTVVIGQEWAGTRPTGKVRIDATIRFVGAAYAVDRWAGIAFGVWGNDTTYADAVTAGQSAYHCLIRRNGVITIYRNSGGAITQLATFTGAVIHSDTSREASVRVRVVIDDAGLTFTNMTSGEKVTAADTTLRSPGRLALSANGADVMFSRVTVTDL